jgi:hypothetical protein
VQACERYGAGHVLSSCLRRLIGVTRQQVAYVYRALRRGGADRGDYADLALRFDKLLPGKAAVILDMLAELGLVAIVATEGALTVTVVDGADKNELDNSTIYSDLKEEVAV